VRPATDGVQEFHALNLKIIMTPLDTKTPTKRFMTIKELAGYFGVSATTIADWKRDGLLIYIQVRRVVRFDAAACEESLRENQIL
jgi:excisionase family DNA binding protein